MKLLNNLYITTQNSYLYKEGESIVAKQAQQKLLRIPAHAIRNIFCFGVVSISPPLMGYCSDKGIGISFFNEWGRFYARVEGRISGNVLLRRSQYRIADLDPIHIARIIIGAKIFNTRAILLRHIRNYGSSEKITETIHTLEKGLSLAKISSDINYLRGIEGECAAAYFNVFSILIRPQFQELFPFSKRTKRPPLDSVNALLSFIYSLLAQEISSALLGTGLDPYVGFLHRDRPGRISLALDIIEEFRAFFADRLVLNLINLQQVKPDDFITEISGSIRLTDKARKIVISAYQTKKKEIITHPYTGDKIPLGLLPHVQSQLLARYLRKDTEYYTPFLVK